MLVPMPDDMVGRMALIEAIRANTDAVKRLADRTDMQDRKLDEIKDAIGKLDTRMTVMESTTLKHEVESLREDHKELDDRIHSIEFKAGQRDAQISFADWIVRSWPNLIGFAGLVLLILFATGKLGV